MGKILMKYTAIVMLALTCAMNMLYAPKSVDAVSRVDPTLITYNVYLPFVTNNYVAPVVSPVKGIAMVQNTMSDLDNVGATWYYNWTPYPHTPINDRIVPMSRCGLYDATFPMDYAGYVIIFNEPANREPFGCGLTPAVAAERYMAFMDTHPNVIPIVGNNGSNGVLWDRYFIRALKAVDYPIPTTWGIHAYYEPYYTMDRWKADFGSYMQMFGWEGVDISEMWITEFAMTSGDPVIFSEMLDYISTLDYVTRVAPFTNRAMYNEPWWPSGWTVELFDDDGILTPIGEAYKSWKP